MGNVPFDEAEPARHAYYYYRSSCTLGSWNSASKLLAVSENYGTSWRGPIQEIRVGSKRRRVVHSFSLTKYRLNDVSTGLWCPGGATSLASKDFFTLTFLNAWNRCVKMGENPTYYKGSNFPPYGSTRVSNLGAIPREQIIQDLFVKLKSPRFNSAVFLGELTETLVSIQGLFMGALRAFTKSGAAVKSLKHLALNSEELWLWYRYFLLPAMMDAEDLLQAIKPVAKIDRVSTGRSKIESNTHGTVYNHGWFANKYTLEIPWTCVSTVGVGGAIDIHKRLDPSPWGTSLADVLAAGWEVIPFSFVIDWFVGVGNFLATLRDVEIDYAQSYATYAVDQTITLHPGKDTAVDRNPQIRYFIMNRITDLEPPFHPLVSDKYKSFIHTVDAIALASGIIKNILRGKRRR